MKPRSSIRYNHSGNCWADAAAYECEECGKGVLCDVCHLHSMPRGDCDECKEHCACEAER